MSNNFKTPKGTELPFLLLKGKQYLQVAHRLVWFREEHPDWTIKTYLIEKDDRHTVARAEIIDATGRLIADGFKEEHAAHFQDHMEKSLTGSVGRALALCGYGTAFAQELEEDGVRIADSPLNAPKASQASAGARTAPTPQATSQNTPQGTYMIPFGKYKGRTLPSIPKDELQNYLNYLDGQARDANKPLGQAAAELFKQASAYLGVGEEDDVPLEWPGTPGV